MLPISPKPLSNIQHLLLRLYATGISDEHLEELNKLIAKFLLDKAVTAADKSFVKNGYSQENIMQWLNED